MSNTNDNKNLLLKAIALLLCESRLAGNGDSSAELVRRIIKESVSPDMVIGRSVDGEVATGLKRIAAQMVENPPNHVYDIETVVLEVKLACASDETITPLIELFLDVKPEDQDKLKLKVINLRKGFDHHFAEKDLKARLTKASIGFSTDRDSIPSVRNYVAQLIADLEKYTVSADERDPAINYCLDMADDDSTLNLIDRIQNQENGKHLLRTGWQGMNRLLDGGWRPGEQWVIGAQEHNWKTGFSLTLFRQVAEVNDAVLINEGSGKIPALVRFSFEDSAEANLEFLFKSLWENENGTIVDKMPEDKEFVSKYIKDKMQAKGWRVFLYDVNPSMWTYKDICNEILRLEARGFEIRLMMLDYLLKIPTTGCDQGPHGVDIRNLYERVKAFCAPKKITMITPHQLSPDAKNVARAGTNNFVKDMMGGGYYSGTKQLGQVVDGEIFINIEKDARENFYLAIQRGKHRKIRQTPVEHRYIVMQFVAGGIIPDDLNKDDTTRTKVGGPTMSELTNAGAVGIDF